MTAKNIHLSFDFTIDDRKRFGRTDGMVILFNVRIESIERCDPIAASNGVIHTFYLIHKQSQP